MKIGNSLNTQEAAAKTHELTVYLASVRQRYFSSMFANFIYPTNRNSPGKNAVGSGGANAPVSSGNVKQFAIGDFEDHLSI